MEFQIRKLLIDIRKCYFIFQKWNNDTEYWSRSNIRHEYNTSIFAMETMHEHVIILKMSLVLRKPVFGVSDHVWHKPGCTATEDGYKLEISDLGRRGIVLSM